MSCMLQGREACSGGFRQGFRLEADREEGTDLEDIEELNDPSLPSYGGAKQRKHEGIHDIKATDRD